MDVNNSHEDHHSPIQRLDMTSCEPEAMAIPLEASGGTVREVFFLPSAIFPCLLHFLAFGYPASPLERNWPRPCYYCYSGRPCTTSWS